MSRKALLIGSLFALGISAVIFGLSYKPATASQSPTRSRIVGTLTDSETNLPIVGEVGITTVGQERVLLKHARSATEGGFSLDGLEAGQFHLSTKVDGYAVERRNVSLAQQETRRVDFQLKRVKKLRGIVRLPNDSPASGARVAVQYPSDLVRAGETKSTYQWETGDFVTGAEGTFEIEVHPDREFIVEVSHPDFLGNVYSPTRVPPDRPDVFKSISLRNGSRIIVDVNDPAGGAVAGAKVALLAITPKSASPRFLSPEALSQRARYGRSGADGTFSFQHVGSGPKRLVVEHPSYRTISREINVSAGQNRSYSVVLGEGAR